MTKILGLFLTIYIDCVLLTTCVAIHVSIGDYGLLEADNECGIGRESQIMDDSCFEWHKLGKSLADIKNGREAMIGEMPYLVYIFLQYEGYSENGTDKEWMSASCTGSILNEHMVVTAGHCFDGQYKCGNESLCEITAVVVFGVHEFERIKHLLSTGGETSNPPEDEPDRSDKNSTSDWHGMWGLVPKREDVIKQAQIDQEKDLHILQSTNFAVHPGYIKNKTKSDDMALIFFNEEIIMRKWFVQPICLPQKGDINKDYELAMISGWGITDPTNPESDPHFLPMGWMRITPPFNNKTDAFGDFVLAKFTPYPNGTVPCMGDSGGPLLQYVNGKAVLIGTVYGDIVYPASVTLCPHNDTSIIAFVRVSTKIDWILEEYKKFKSSIDEEEDNPEEEEEETPDEGEVTPDEGEVTPDEGEVTPGEEEVNPGEEEVNPGEEEVNPGEGKGNKEGKGKANPEGGNSEEGVPIGDRGLRQ